MDAETRCVHYHSVWDIIAIKMKCCGDYACKDCHDALADHSARVWPKAAWDEPAVLCGGQMTVRQYLDCADRCPACGAPFNPGCRSHRHFYFETGACPPPPAS